MCFFYVEVISSLNCIAIAQFYFLTYQGKYAEAEPLYERSLAIREKVLGPEHPLVAQLLNNRAAVFASQVGAVKKFQ